MELAIHSISPFSQLLPSPEGMEKGPLQDYRFAVKDVFNLAGFRTQAGNPDYFAKAPLAETTAEAVSLLQDAGAKLVGKTHTDELGGSLFGINDHYGTPLNTHSPDRVPGGSSSGSAAAVAAGLIDFALGADTSGSVRAPASFCGIYGFRPTLGKISTEGVLPISKHLDTVGIFARDPQIICQVLAIYGMKEQSQIKGLKTVPTLIKRLSSFFQSAFGEDMNLIKSLADYEAPIVLEEDKLKVWSKTIRTIAMYDLWQVHKSWILKDNPSFGKLIQERLKLARSISFDDYKIALVQAKEAKKTLNDILSEGELLVFPTVHDIPPLLNTSPERLKEFALKASLHTCMGALSGFPEIVIPLRERGQSGTVGLSFIAREGRDASLPFFATAIEKLFSETSFLNEYKGNLSTLTPTPKLSAV